MRSLLNRDLLAGLGAGTFAIAATFLPELQAIAHPSVAGSFALVALGFWYRGRPKAEPASPVYVDPDPTHPTEVPALPEHLR